MNYGRPARATKKESSPAHPSPSGIRTRAGRRGEYRGGDPRNALRRESEGVLLRGGSGWSHRGYPRLEWTVLDWNAPSIAFYRKLGAEPMDEWTTQRVSGPELQHLARVIS